MATISRANSTSRDDYAYSNIEGNTLSPQSSAIKLLTRSDRLMIFTSFITILLLACGITATCVVFYLQHPNISYPNISSVLHEDTNQICLNGFIEANVSSVLHEDTNQSCLNDFTEANAFYQQGVNPRTIEDYKALQLPLCWTRERYERWQNGTLPSRRENSCHTCKSDVGLSIRDFMVNVITGVVHHRDRADVIACTWMQEFPADQFWFHSDEPDEEERLPVFRAITEKGDWSTSQLKWIPGMLHTMKRAREIEQRDNRTIKWHVVADDDTIMFPNNLIRLASQYDHNLPLIIASVNNGYSNGVPYGGAGWIFSHAAAQIMEKVLHKCDRYKDHQQSDVFIGVCLQELTNIRMIDRREFGSQPPMYYLDMEWEHHQTGFYRAVSFHYIKDWHDYLYIYQLYKAFSFNIYQ